MGTVSNRPALGYSEAVWDRLDPASGRRRQLADRGTFRYVVALSIASVVPDVGAAVRDGDIVPIIEGRPVLRRAPRRAHQKT